MIKILSKLRIEGKKKKKEKKRIEGNFLNLIKGIYKNSGTSLVAQWLRIRLQCRGQGFEPWSGKIPHAAEQLSPCATTIEPAL